MWKADFLSHTHNFFEAWSQNLLVLGGRYTFYFFKNRPFEPEQGFDQILRKLKIIILLSFKNL
jgi:hypothetical protein